MIADKSVVLDAWPVVEYYEGNTPSAIEVDKLLSEKTTEAVMCSVNFAEVYSAIASIARDFAVAMQFVESLKSIVTIDEPSVEIAKLAALVKHCYHMSLGDSFAAATAISRSSGLWLSNTRSASKGQPAEYVPLWTGDSELLSDDRVWEIHDLRSVERKNQHETEIAAGRKKAGRRAGTEKGWSILTNPSNQPA